MRKIVFIIILAMLGSFANAQDTGKLSKREQRKLLKEERKKEEANAAAEYAKLVDYMVKNSEFVLEADMLFDKYGNSQPVSSTVNFISVDSTEGVLQVGSPMYLGRNGVGGVTIDGNISDYEFTKNEKRGSYTINYNLISPVGSYDVNISVSESGRADARVSGNFSSGSLRYSGKLVHPKRSRVYKGMAL